MANDPMRYEVRNEAAEQKLREIGRMLKDNMPDGFGFTVLVFSYKGKELFYISSAEREGMIETMREFIAKFEEN
jgi:hypothetical protein